MGRTTATVDRIPNCDFCGQPAQFDGATKQGPWAYMCKSCFDQNGRGLGLGKGQELIVKKEG